VVQKLDARLPVSGTTCRPVHWWQLARYLSSICSPAELQLSAHSGVVRWRIRWMFFSVSDWRTSRRRWSRAESLLEEG